MLIIDGVKYEAWTPKSEEEFEQVVKEHTQDIFGEQSIYLDRKQKLKSLSGIGSIPDGYVISLQEEPCWYICEVEFHTHPLYEHIIAQLQKIITAAKTLQSQGVVRDAIYTEIKSAPFKEALIKSKIGTEDLHHFISNLISKPPILVIPIDQKIDGLEEACNGLPIEEVRIVEFKTFVREGIGLAVHAHLFEPVYVATLSVEPKVAILNRPIKAETGETRRKVVVSPTGEKLSRTKFVERFASESERNASVTNKKYPHAMVDTPAKFEAFLAKHPECAGWTLRDNT